MYISSISQLVGSVPPGDLLGALVNGLAIAVGISSTLWLTPKIADRGAKRDRKERLLRLLLATWQTPANPDYQAAITLAALDFHDDPSVLLARSQYIEHVNVIPVEEDLQAHFTRSRELQINIMVKMADVLDYDITAPGLLSQAYLTQGFVDRDLLNLNAMAAWPRIAAALEAANDMARGTIQPAENSETGP